MRFLIQLAIAGILAVGLVGFALLTQQNVTPVSLRLLMFQSVQIPVGLLLVMGTAGGLILGALTLPGSGRRRPSVPSQRELEREFDFGEDF